MFKAIDRRTEQEIVILDLHWADRVDHLRALGRKDILICPRCKQPVRVRTPKVRRWHFAHKHLQNCPYDYESPRLLKARALLYQCLVSRFEGGVTLEKEPGNNYFPRSVDCWVAGESGDIGYWIIESRMKPERRDGLKRGFEEIGAKANWVFMADMLRKDEIDPNNLHLTTTEREFMQRSVYDQPVERSRFNIGKSLHYLDPDSEILTTFRGLQLIHAPQLYAAGCTESHPMSEVLVLRNTGEFGHPGEHERLEKYKEEEQKRIEAEKRRVTGLREFTKGASARGRIPHPIPGPEKKGSKREEYRKFFEKEEATCEICGKRTRDWWTVNRATNTCKCYDCLRKGKQR
jgi:hypothetical protein